MADDADSQLLDRIGGKYGEDGDYDDLGNADEDALLDEDNVFDESAFESSNNTHSNAYPDGNEDYYNELDDTDTDVLDLEAQDVELDDDLEDKINAQPANSITVTSTTTLDLDSSMDLERGRATDKFKSERQHSIAKLNTIPDSLEEVPVIRNIRNNRGQFRGRGRGFNFKSQPQRNNVNKNRNDNKTVLINPHFKGQVKINNDARLAWDARHRLNQRHQGRGHNLGNRKPNSVEPWNQGVAQPNNQPYQGIQSSYQSFQQPQPAQQVWTPFQGNTYNQIPNQQIPVNQQHVFMQPLPPPITNIYPNQQPPQYQPPQYNSHMFQNQPVNVGYTPQYIPPPNQYNQQPEPFIPNFSPNQPPPGYMPQESSFMPPPPSNPRYNQHINNQYNPGPPHNVFNSQNRFVQPKPSFNNHTKKFIKTSPIKRRVDVNIDVRKKKRNLSSSNLHEVQTIPDTTTISEDKQLEDEDEDMKLYKRKIEEQKRLREKVLADKEKRRLEAILVKNEGTSNAVVTPVVVSGDSSQPQRKLQPIRTNATIQKLPQSKFNNFQMMGKNNNTKPNTNIKVINTEESNYDKQHLTSFLSNRKILAKDQSLIDTTIVVVSNLAAGTSDVKLRKLCQGIGDVKKLQMSPKERLATIQFNSVASAHAFFKKFQRTMLDLSVIQVALEPMS